MADTPLVPLTYAPSSDIASGTKPHQIVWGRTGNDIVFGYQPLGANIRNDQIDVFLGDSETSQLVDPAPRDWHNQFIFGDWRTPYYTNGNLFLFGLNNFALIADFDSTKDTIQLYGQSSNYQLLDLGIGTVVTYQQEIFPNIFVPDVIAILPSSGLNLNSSYFQYVGYTAPKLVNSNIKQIGTEGLEMTDSITVDTLGNVYVAGTTTGSLIASNVGLRDIWFSKYDSSGNLLFSRQFGTTATDSVFSIVTDSENNVFMVGLSQGDLSGPLQGVNTDAWIAKYDSNGNQQWLKKITGSGQGQPASSYGIDFDAVGNVYLSGVVDVPTPPDSEFPLSTDNFVAKYDNNGNQQWIVQEGKPGIYDFDEAYKLTVDREGNSYSVGFTTSDFAGTPATLYDAWISKHDSSGQQEWIRQIATPDYDWAWGVGTDSIGNSFVTGWTLGSLAGTTGNLGSYDAWLAKYDKNGNQQWVRQFGTSGDDEAFAVKVDSRDNIYVTGYTDAAFAGHTNKGSFDAWVAKFDNLGNQQWIQQFGTPGTEQAYDITVSGSSVYITGITDGSLGTANQGSFDTWVVKLNGENGNIENFTATLDSYIQPQRQGSQILASADTLGQFSQSLTSQADELFASVPKDVDLVQLGTNTSAQIFNTTPDVLANYSSSQNLLSANLTPSGKVLTPSGGVGTTSIAPTNQLLTQFSNVDLNSLLLPSAQPSIFNL